MKKFFGCLLDGVLATVALVLFTIVAWVFITLAAVVIVGLSPIWAVLLVRSVQRASDFTEKATETLVELETMLDGLGEKKDG